MLRMINISHCYGMKAFTESGEFFGAVEELLVGDTKITAWRINSVKGSRLYDLIGKAKGVIVPHQLIKSVGDIVIIADGAVPKQAKE